MLNDNLIIADDDYLQSKSAYFLAASQIEEQLTAYLKVLQEIVDNKALEGEAANTLKSFASLADEMIGSQLTYVMEYHQRQMGDYIAKIDEADSFLY